MDFAAARHFMVEGQIRTNRVTDALLIDAMEALPREAFLSDALKGRAYIDEDIEVAPGRIMMEPRVIARMLQEAEIDETDLGLMIGSATGYEAACMARLASAVVALESNVDLADHATTTLLELGVDTVSVFKGDISKGHPAQAPFDAIVINGAVSEIPQNLLDQLADGGRLVCVVKTPGAVPGRATLIQRTGLAFSQRQLFDANIPLLPEFAKAPTFSF